MLRHGWLSAFAIVLQFDTHLRAHNVLALEASYFMPPAPGTKDCLRRPWALLVAPLARGVPTKAGQFNASLLVGNKDPWLPRFMSSCMKHLPLAGKVLDLTHEEYAKRLPAAAASLGLLFRVLPHQLRHSGPSHDKYYEHRDLVNI